MSRSLPSSPLSQRYANHTSLLGMFYNRRQIAFRTAILYSGSQLGNAFGTLLAIGITELDGKHGLAGWRW